MSLFALSKAVVEQNVEEFCEVITNNYDSFKIPSPLCGAVLGSQDQKFREMAILLLERGQHLVDAREVYNWPSLMFHAVNIGNPEIVEILYSFGINPMEPNFQWGFPIQLAIQKIEEIPDNPNLVQLSVVQREKVRKERSDRVKQLIELLRDDRVKNWCRKNPDEWKNTSIKHIIETAIAKRVLSLSALALRKVSPRLKGIAGDLNVKNPIFKSCSGFNINVLRVIANVRAELDSN